MDSNWTAAEKENVRNKEELREFVQAKLRAYGQLRQEQEVDVEEDFICFADLVIADEELSKSNEAMISELMSAF